MATLPATGALESHLAEASGRAARIAAIEPLVGGACQDNFVISVAFDDGPATRYVLRSDAAGALPGSLSRREELAVITAAVRAGVPTPPARWLGRSLVREGAWAYFMEWADGVAIGAKVLKDPSLAGARAKLPEQLALALAAIHRVTPDALQASLPAQTSGRPGDDPVEVALAHQRASLDALGAPRPALELVLRWLREHRPRRREVTLVHGDFRTGNFLVTPDGLSAVLDWEFAHLGCPEEDLAWLCVRDWRFGQLTKAAGGLVERATFYRAYERASGRAVDPSDVHYWEVMGNLRWAAGALVQGQRYAKGERDLELLAIARRAAEMEWEALRLLEQGPPRL